MSLHPRSSRVRAFLVLVALAAGSGWVFAQTDSVAPTALSQIQALMQEKRARTPAQQKVQSNLLFEEKQRRGLAIAPGVPALQTGIEVNTLGEVVVDITASVTDSLVAALESLGGHVLVSVPEYRSLRAEMPLSAVQTLAAHPDVVFIQPKQQFLVNRGGSAAPAPALRGVTPSLLKNVRPGFAARAATVRSGLSALLAGQGRVARPEAILKTNTSEGVKTHRADLAISTFGANGSGVKVGVLSDGVNSLATLQGSGDLPAGVTVLAGQAGSGDEGSAMLEIVYDMAPGAQLYFATAFSGIGSFAQNIKNLRTAGCDIIIDDVGYFIETPFQKGQAPSVVSNTNGGIVTQAVNDVTAAGALYFSSSANSGSKNKGTSGTWEGDFADGGAAGPPIPEAGRLHNFGGANYDALTASTGAFPVLFWSDPLGGSGNDYDLFLLDSAGATVVAASDDSQTGTQDPVEIINVNSLTTGQRLVVVKFAGAARFLHLDTNRGRLTFNTQGSTRGHNAPPGANAFGIAATPAVFPGPYPSPFNSSNHVENFSSDGPRHFFFNADSSAITPGDFSSTGGQIIQQPLLTAADGVSCAAPGFNPFYGTSAAAPHAGAIAALVKSRNPSLTASQITSILLSSAIDIEAAGVDRDSGYGILDAFTAVQSAGPTGVKGDFNGDGHTDILWRHTSGTVYVFLMNGTIVTSGATLFSVDPSWSIVGTADFNGDGKTDILWRNTSGALYVWLMNGTAFSAGVSLGSVDPAWSIAATGDFNNDGKPDILWRHTSGAIYVWFMNGTAFISAASLGSVDPAWSIAATGDFNGDGKADILWHHTSGSIYVWFMNGTTFVSAVNLGSVDPAWNISAAGDFNGDTKPDILWRHTSGDVYVWLMNGTAFASGAALPSVDTSWKIVGPK